MIATDMLVIDSSAVLALLLSGDGETGLRHRVATDGDLHAPHLVDVEVLHVLRRLTLRGSISVDRAMDARADFADLAILRYPHTPLGDRMWELRENLTAYDAAFVALAEALEAPLVTCDRSLAGAPNVVARVEVFAP